MKPEGTGRVRDNMPGKIGAPAAESQSTQCPNPKPHNGTEIAAKFTLFRYGLTVTSFALGAAVVGKHCCRFARHSAR